MPAKLILNRRGFLKTAGGAAALAGAAFATFGSPAFFKQCVDDLTSGVADSDSKPTPNDWSDSKITASWLGHSTVLINFFGLNVLTDPVLQNRIGADLGLAVVGPRRRVAPALAVRDLPRIDLVLLSHAHLDHTDICTLNQLKAGPQAVVATRNTDLLCDTRISGTTELKWGQKTVIKSAGQGDIEIEAFEVKHWGARWRHDTYRGYNGYILRRGGKQILFGGDTAKIDTFARLKSKGPFELALMPIGAYQPYIWNHCNPEQAVEMANAAGAKYIMPIHHTTFRLGREVATEPLERFETALAKETDRIALRQIGQTFVTC